MSADIGQTKDGRKRYVCQNTGCTRATFMCDYSYHAYQPGIKETIIDMTMSGSGVRDIARVLSISPTTVIDTLKKRGSARINQHGCAQSLRE